jgi:hypothetical protein
MSGPGEKSPKGRLGHGPGSRCEPVVFRVPLGPARSRLRRDPPGAGAAGRAPCSHAEVPRRSGPQSRPGRPARTYSDRHVRRDRPPLVTHSSHGRAPQGPGWSRAPGVGSSPAGVRVGPRDSASLPSAPLAIACPRARNTPVGPVAHHGEGPRGGEGTRSGRAGCPGPASALLPRPLRRLLRRGRFPPLRLLAPRRAAGGAAGGAAAQPACAAAP